MTDAAQAMTAFWSAQATAMLEAQQKMARTMADGMAALFSKEVEVPGGMGGFSQASEAMGTLWSAATKMAGELAERIGSAPGEAGSAGLIERMLDPRQFLSGTNGLDDLLTRVADGPRLADLWEFERRTARGLRAWSEVRRHAFEQQRIALEAWMEAGRRYMEELSGHAGADGQPLDPKGAFRLWTEVANQQLIQTQRSEPYLQAQRNLIRASTELKLAQAEMGEEFGKHWGLPTRTEMDDVHKALTEMRREVRRLVRAAQPPPQPPAPTPAATPAPAPAQARRRRAAS